MSESAVSSLARPKTIVFFGISGAGKGTQVDLLRTYLERRDIDRHVLHFDMGSGLREIAKTPTLLGRKVEAILKAGTLVPSFIASHVFTDYMAMYFRDTDHLLIDGTPRRVAQASSLDAQLEFYDRMDYELVYFELTQEEAHKRLVGRGRSDDIAESAIAHRFAFFQENCLPALKLLEERGRKVHRIDASPSRDDIHAKVLEALQLPL